MRNLAEWVEGFRIAARQIAANRTRSILTTLGVAIGIIAVTLMGTAICGIDTGFNRSMSGFGDDVLYHRTMAMDDARRLLAVSKSTRHQIVGRRSSEPDDRGESEFAVGVGGRGAGLRPNRYLWETAGFQCLHHGNDE